MNSHVILRSLRDENTLFDGLAQIDPLNGGWLVRMTSETTECVWKILPRGIVIENRENFENGENGETSSTFLSLFDSGKGKARILTPFGELEAELSNIRIERSEHLIHVTYSIAPEEDFCFELRCDDFCFSSPDSH